MPVLHVVQARLAYVAAEGELKQPFKDELPTRQAQLSTLQDTEEFDVLVVGGGATGSGCALDAVTRSESPRTASFWKTFLVGVNYISISVNVQESRGYSSLNIMRPSMQYACLAIFPSCILHDRRSTWKS